MAQEINQFSEKTKEYGNTGFRDLIANKRGAICGAVACVRGFSQFKTIEDAYDLAKWNAKFRDIKTKRAFMLPLFDGIEDMSEEDVYDEGLQGSKFSAWGNAKFKATIDVNAYQEWQLRGFSEREMDVYLLDVAQNILGFSPDNTKIEGFSMMIHVGKTPIVAKGEKVKLPVFFTVKSSQEWIYPVVIEPTVQTTAWNPLTDFDGVYDVDLTQVSASATTIVLDVTKKSIDPAFGYAAVSGLVLADFVHSGGVMTAAEESDTVPGRYMLTGTFVNDGTINLVSCASISITTPFIESTGAMTISGIKLE